MSIADVVTIFQSPRHIILKGAVERCIDIGNGAGGDGSMCSGGDGSETGTRFPIFANISK
jgi:hypothetical protein